MPVNSADRTVLHDLVDRLPGAEIGAALRYLEFLSLHPAARAALTAPPDDEPVTDDEIADVRLAEADVRAGRVSSHEDVLREFGLMPRDL